MRKKDNLTDIPLTPSQRALLGLDPNDTPPNTANAQYITPPRYRRSSTPRNGSPSTPNSSNNNSPFSKNASPSQGPLGNEPFFSPSASLMWQKAVGGSRDSSRRHSYGSSTPLRIGLGMPNTPSPPIGRGASVGLNSRWLYERGRVNSGSRTPYS